YTSKTFSHWTYIFQAEDGIRDFHVTGDQTCALPIYASHEQFAPSELLALVQHAESAGFQALMSSDHLAPWSERQGHSGFMWSWRSEERRVGKETRNRWQE